MISAVTFIRDSERFIRQHFRMYRGMKNYGLFVPHRIVGGADNHGEADESLEIVRREFPDVEIVQSGHYHWDCAFINKMIEIGEQSGDKVLIFHADVVMEADELAKLLTFIEGSDYDIYKLDMRRCTINYYCDLDHGLRDCLDVEPIAVRAGVRFSSGIYQYPPERYRTVVIEGITNHHFTGWKGPASSHEFVDGPEGAARAAQYGGWIPAPPGLREIFR